MYVQVAKQAGRQAEEFHLGEIQRDPETCQSGETTDNRGPPPEGVCLETRALRESEYNRGTGCGKTARPGLCGGRRVTGVPTAEEALLH